MKTDSAIYVFGEVLFDVFPDGKTVLGGAPFNVAWHLQAMGDAPLLLSRVGCDQAGREIRTAMLEWKLSLAGLQEDRLHPSGKVDVQFAGGEPVYRIVPDCAYDFIDATALPPAMAAQGILYHGTLALRNDVSQRALKAAKKIFDPAIFVDVNLRTPWWNKEQVLVWLEEARWVKLNREELHLLGDGAASDGDAAREFVRRFDLEQLIVTCGRDGAFVCSADGRIHRGTPPVATEVVDTVGAGDAFTAVYLHGLLQGWSVTCALHAAQMFAGKVVGLRGATSREHRFYQEFLQDLRGIEDRGR